MKIYFRALKNFKWKLFRESISSIMPIRVLKGEISRIEYFHEQRNFSVLKLYWMITQILLFLKKNNLFNSHSCENICINRQDYNRFWVQIVIALLRVDWFKLGSIFKFTRKNALFSHWSPNQNDTSKNTRKFARAIFRVILNIDWSSTNRRNRAESRVKLNSLI